jgi:hypothetical protein
MTFKLILDGIQRTSRRVMKERKAALELTTKELVKPAPSRKKELKNIAKSEKATGNPTSQKRAKAH